MGFDHPRARSLGLLSTTRTSHSTGSEDPVNATLSNALARLRQRLQVHRMTVSFTCGSYAFLSTHVKNVFQLPLPKSRSAPPIPNGKSRSKSFADRPIDWSLSQRS